jgi:ABC-2 type transport system ATP-binding protein
MMIIVKNLSKRYGKILAADRVNLQANPGKITVLLGPNGAGKSTTIKSIAGLLKYEGDIYIGDFPNYSKQAKQSFGYVPEMPALYDALTVKEHLRFISKAYHLNEDEAKIDDLLKRFNMLDNQKKLAKELSKGMMQKLSFLCAMIIEPKALLVDEPLLGLDPSAIEEMLNLFVELREKGTSILLSTHIIDMIDGIWDEAYIMNKGKIVNYVTKETLDGKHLKQIFFESVGERL